MQTRKIIAHIVDWLTDYSSNSNTKGFVIGVSGGIDSAVTSTLCAMTGKPIICVNMPIHQAKLQFTRAEEHIARLKNKFDNVTENTVNLTDNFENWKTTLPTKIQDELVMANIRARMRMTTLYAFAGNAEMLVAGTGNKVEDFGVGFFTKYGDGGVDLSPIADLNKTDVFALAKELNIIESIQTAEPTDGLFGDVRSDQDQLGATYPELEWAMEYTSNEKDLSEREQEVLAIYKRLNGANKHKMIAIPVCKVSDLD
ncbi:MAG: NAD(+) synthase [Flavobacteriales bacterium]|nr:NAD(+) synthase [Flavobacteriales bacterium]